MSATTYAEFQALLQAGGGEFDCNADETIDSDGAARLLHCDTKRIEELARDGELPATKIGRGWLFVRAQLLEAIVERAKAESTRRKAAKPSFVAIGIIEPPVPVTRGRGRPRTGEAPLPKFDS